MTNAAALAQVVGRFAQMRSVAARAVQDHPMDVRALYGAAMAFRLSGDLASAHTALALAAKAEPDNTHVLFERGVIEEYLGQFDAAAASYRRALSAEPLNYKARQALVQLEKQSIANNSIAELESQFSMAPDADGWRTLHLGHALAKTFEDMGDAAQSFAWLERAKARRRVIAPYNAAREEAVTNAAMATAAALRSGDDSSEPIFVAGLPRSGTTLVDRILSSHADVMSAGEIGNFSQIYKALSGSTTPATLDVDGLSRADGVDFAQLGRAYVESTRPLTGAKPRFVDKAPSNYLLAGLILRALPNARVICIRRHPLDSVLSNYKQIFPIDDRYYDYVYGLESAAHKVVQLDRILAHWKRTLPSDRFLELRYENLVANQEARTRELVAFCGLAWDPRCLAFHENAAGVATPSARQVRSAMNANAVGRAAKYGALLDPARQVLERAGIALD
ncbi:MAG: sulfotransferase [Hyphomonadaceae bacterium]